MVHTVRGWPLVDPLDANGSLLTVGNVVIKGSSLSNPRAQLITITKEDHWYEPIQALSRELLELLS